MEGSFAVILVVALCATSLLRPGLAASIPGSPIDLKKCWSSLLSIQGCKTEIFKSVLSGKFEHVGATCCKAFTEVDAKCWPKMFPLNPRFPPLLKHACSRIKSAPPAHTTPEFPIIHGVSLPSSPVDLKNCLSSLVNIQGCITEINKSVLTGKFDNVGPICCKTFSAIDGKCWPQMFPLHPFFPPLLKNACSRINAPAPTHK